MEVNTSGSNDGVNRTCGVSIITFCVDVLVGFNGSAELNFSGKVLW